MTEADRAIRSDRPLSSQLRWFVSLRWIAAGAVIIGAALDRYWLGWFAYPRILLATGVAMLAYNAVLWWLLRSAAGDSPGRRALLTLAWAQILLDLTCLTLLTIRTGGLHSPLLGFFVFHMVFASLLLPRTMAYGGATLAIVGVALALRLTGRLPADREETLALSGWALTLLFTVFLANRITSGLRRQRRRLVRKNKRIRLMAARLHRQQRAMVQHEKMVALGQMAAGIAHEIANPLASMDSVLQLVQRKPDRLRQDTVNTIREQVDRIHQIIQQMSSFAHPSGTQWQAMPVNEVVEQSLAILRFDARMKRVRLEKQLSPDVGAVVLMPQALQQVLVNLIRNALDAMADVAEPVLTVRTQQQDGWWLTEISDNGSGIRPEHLDHLFEPFFTTKPVGQGTGLGLSISYSLIEKHGGHIDVKSKVGEGSTFRVRLPAKAQQAMAGGEVRA